MYTSFFFRLLSEYFILFDDTVNGIVFISSLFSMCARAMMCCVCGGKRTAFGSKFSPFPVWVLVMEFKESGLAASAFTLEPSPGSVVF